MKRKLLASMIVAAAVLSAAMARAATLNVGPGQQFAAPCAAILAANAGDTIEIDSSVVYVGDVCAWSTPSLTIVGVGGARAHIDAGGQNSQGKAIWVISGANTTIENIEFSGAAVVDQNGAGIRQQADNLTIRNCYFHDNQEGILTDASLTSTITIEFSEFAYNGFGDGQSHNVYIGNIGTLIFRYNYSHHAIAGHLLKTRAANNFIIANRLSDEATGESSYQIDVPNGGLTYIIGNVIEQGPQNQNSTFIAYLEEGTNAGNPDHHMYVINNTFANDAPTGTFIQPAAVSDLPVVITNNIFFGPGTVTSQSSAIQSHNFAGNPNFVNSSVYDYHLTAGSPAIDAGIDPGSNGTFSLTPPFQYVHPACAEGRTTVSTIDMGGYEFGGGTGTAPPNGNCGTASGPSLYLSGKSLVYVSQSTGTTSAAQHLTVTNAGNSGSNIANIASSGDFSQTNNCGATLPAGATCTILVTFTPTASGARTGTIIITDSAPGSPHIVNLAGNGSTTVPPPSTDFSVSANPGSATVMAGQSAPYSVTVGSSGGFNQPVTLSCSGLPSGTICTFNPPAPNPNGSTVTAQLSISSTARAALAPRPMEKHFPAPSVWVVLATLALVVALAVRNQKQLPWAMAVLALALLTGSSGCGSNASKNLQTPLPTPTPTPTGGGTPAGTYMVTVTGTSGTQTHKISITLIVN